MKVVRHAPVSGRRPRPVAHTAAAVLVIAAIACGNAATPPPAPLDTNNDACASCRMAVSDRRLASQVLVPGEEPRFFDDLGCLSQFLREHQRADAVVYVADHRTGEWVPGEQAVYSRIAAASTPMGSGLVAHAAPESRAQDPDARRGVLVDAGVVLGRSAGGGRQP